MKKIFVTIMLMVSALTAFAQGWPERYGGVMLQGFYWDSYTQSQWSYLEYQADVLAEYFSLVWLPQSANCGGNQSMGYDDLYWFNNYNSSFGSEKELRSLISALKERGTGVIADVVINHRKNVSSWVDFPLETYDGKTYQLQSTDICANDDGGATRTWATANGFSLSTNNDDGEDWGGMRDLDHNSENVRANVLAYLDFLQKDLGYAGFRYDMVKGYAAKHTGYYNSNAQPEFSVGEYWDGNTSNVLKWLNGTKVDGKIQSAAFDFPFRYTLRDATNNNDWTKLDNASLAAQTAYRRYAVTFVENHDTEKRSATTQQDPIRRDTLAANAFMLAMPGTPCVFYKHWIDCKQDIAKMIRVRNLMGIHNESTTEKVESIKNRHVHIANGDKGRLLCVVGKAAAAYTPADGWHLAAKGYRWAYYTDTPIDIGEITFPEEHFDPYDITVHVNVDKVGWQNVNFWTWGGDDSHSPTNKNWPGDRVTAVKTMAGKNWYYKTFTINSIFDCVNFVFSTNTGSPQTVDINNVKHDAWFEVQTTKDGQGKYLVDDVTEATGIEGVTIEAASLPGAIYNLQGQRVSLDYHGIVVKNGKKMMR